MNLKSAFYIGAATLFFAVNVTVFTNCSKMSTSQSETVNEEVTASVMTGFIAPYSKKGQASRLVQRSIETQQEKTFVVLKEYRHKLLDRYFLTSRDQDQTIVENGVLKSEWELTGQRITIAEKESAGYSPLCRFYLKSTKTHFYTANPNECQQFKVTEGFVFEGIEGYVVFKDANQSCGLLKPIYRLYSATANSEKNRHRYVVDSSFVTSHVNKGWRSEGLSFCAESVVWPTTPVYPSEFATAASSVWPGSVTQSPGNSSSVCNPGSETSNGCPVFSGGVSVRRCNSAGTGYGQCRASCHDPNYLISGMTSINPTCVQVPRCSAGKTLCRVEGYSRAEDNFSVACGEDGFSYARDVENGAWNYLGNGIIQRKDNPTVSGSVCCMKKDGSGLGCTTESVSLVPAEIIPDDQYVSQNPPQTNPPVNNQKSCSFNGQTVAHGSTVTAFQSATSTSSCVSQVRTCQNGTLSGSYGFSSCTVTPTQPTNPPTGGVVNYCPQGQGYPNYVWSSMGKSNVTDIRPQIGDNTYVIEFKVDANQSSAGLAQANLNKLLFAEAPGSPSTIKHIRISKNPCDFSSSALLIANDGSDGWRQIAVNDPNRSGSGFVHVTTGTWYINVKNINCADRCDTRVEFPSAFPTVTSTPPPSQPVTPPAGTACLSIPTFLRNNPLSLANSYRKTYSTSTLADASHDQYRLKGNNTIWSVPLIVNAGDTTAGKLVAQLNFGEAPASQRAFRKVVISKSACDMSQSAGNFVIATQSNSGSVEITINDASRGKPVTLTTGQYYINFQNTSCPTDQYCDALVEWLGSP